METISINIKTNVNDGIKEMRDYRKEINELRGQLINLDESSEEYARTLQEVADKTFKLREMNENIRYTVTDLGEKFKTLTRIGKSVASGFEVVQGTMALFGVESEALEQTMVKLQAAISIVQGLEGLEDLGRQLGIAKIQFGGALKSVKGFITGLNGMKVAIAATGIGLLVVAVGALVANWDKLKEKIFGTNNELKQTNEFIEKFQRLISKADEDFAYLQKLEEAKGETKENLLKKEIEHQVTQLKIAKEALEKFYIRDYTRAVLNPRTSEDERKKAEEQLEEYRKIVEERNRLHKKAIRELNIFYVQQETERKNKEVETAKQLKEERAEVLEDMRLAEHDEESRAYAELTKEYERRKKLFKGQQEELRKVDEWYKNERLKIAKTYIDAENDEYQKDVENAKKVEAEKVAAAEKAAAERLKAEQELTKENKEKYDNQKAQIEEYYQYLTYLNERQMTTSTLPWGNYVDELNKIQSQMKLIQDQANEELANIDNEILNNPDLTLENYQFLCDEEIRIRRETNDKLDALGNQQVKTQKAKNSAIAQFTIQAFSQAFSSAAGLISALQANIDTSTEEGFEQSKKYQKAQVWMNTASGILAAIASAWQLGPIAGAIMGAINSAFTLATGIAQIANIDKQKFDSPSNISGSASAGGSANIAASILPTSITSNALAQETEIDLQSQRDMRVYVVESDISQTQNDIKTKVDESTF